jgi:hypothetical protein
VHTVALPRDLAAAPVGTIRLDPGTHALNIFVREERLRLSDYPNPCRVETLLPAWDRPPALAVALLLRVAKKERLIFQVWLDVRHSLAMQVLNNLSGEVHVYLNVATDAVERSIRVPNTIKRHAVRIVRQLSERPPNWTDEDFENACRQVETLYPTPSKLWHACDRDTR